MDIDIKDAYGKRVGYISGSDIKDTYGNRVGYISGSDIKDTTGIKVGYISGNASNNEIAAAALLLLQPKKPDHGPGGFDLEGAGLIGVVLMGIWTILKGIILGIVNYFDGAFDFKGTATRKDWWVKCLLGLLVLIIGSGIITGLSALNLPVIIQFIIFLIVFTIIMIPIVAVSVRRMHDIGKRGWWILIPIVGFVLCAFIRGEQ